MELEKAFFKIFILSQICCTLKNRKRPVKACFCEKNYSAHITFIKWHLFYLRASHIWKLKLLFVFVAIQYDKLYYSKKNNCRKHSFFYLILDLEFVFQERESSKFPRELEGSQDWILRRQCYQGRRCQCPIGIYSAPRMPQGIFHSRCHAFVASSINNKWQQQSKWKQLGRSPVNVSRVFPKATVCLIPLYHLLGQLQSLLSTSRPLYD